MTETPKLRTRPELEFGHRKSQLPGNRGPTNLRWGRGDGWKELIWELLQGRGLGRETHLGVWKE